MSGTKNQAWPSLQATRCRVCRDALDVMCSARQLRALAAAYGASALTVASPTRVAMPLGKSATLLRTWRSVALAAAKVRPVSFASATSRAVGCRTEEHARGSNKSGSDGQCLSVARPSIGPVESFPKHSGAIMLRTAGSRNRAEFEAFSALARRMALTPPGCRPQQPLRYRSKFGNLTNLSTSLERRTSTPFLAATCNERRRRSKGRPAAAPMCRPTLGLRQGCESGSGLPETSYIPRS